MKYSTKKLPNCELEIQVSEISDDLISKFEEQSLKELSKEVKIQGFREGNVPPDMVKKQVGEEKLRLQMIHNALPDIWTKTIDENKIHPIAHPEVGLESIDPVVVLFKVVLRPEIEVGDYKKIKVPENKVKVGDKEVKETIDNILKQNREGKEVDRAAKMGDKAEIDFTGKTKDGVPLDNTSSKNHPVILGENTLLPDFEKNVVGMKPGEEKEFTMTFPKDYHAKTMAGKEVVFEIKLNRLEEMTEPKVDKELAKKVFGKEMEKDEFEKEVAVKLKEQMEEQAKRQREDGYFAELLKITKGEIPHALIAQEQETMLNEMKQKIMYQGLSFDEYLKHMKKTEDELKDSMKQEAENRIKLQFAVFDITKKENLTVDDKEIDEEIEKMLERYEEKEQDKTRKNFAKGSKNYEAISHQLLFKKTLETILPK